MISGARRRGHCQAGRRREAPGPTREPAPRTHRVELQLQVAVVIWKFAVAVEPDATLTVAG